MRLILSIAVPAVLALTLAVQAEELKTNPQYTVEVDEAKWPYSSVDKHFHLWTPEDTPVIKGLFAFVFHGCGQNFAEHTLMRSLATELGCGIVGFDKFYMYPGSEAPSSVLLNALKELAEAAGRPEVAHAPIFTFGHSNGTRFSAGFASKEPDRTFGWMAFKSAYGAQFSIPALYNIPSLIISGETDESYFSDQLATVRRLRYQHRALMHMIVEPGVGHGPAVPSTYTILLAFMKTAFQVRVPADADPRLGPVKLIELEESEGWLGQTLDGTRVKPALDVKRDWEQPEDVRRKLEIAPYADYPGDNGFASWFPTEDYARKWQQFCMQPNLPQWSEPLEPKAITLEERFEQAQRLESSDPPAAANAYATFEGTQFDEAAAARLQDANFVKLCEAREQLKRMWIAEMTLQNPPRFGRFAANFHEINAEPLATIAEAANILHTRYADTADAKTALLMLERYRVSLPQD